MKLIEVKLKDLADFYRGVTYEKSDEKRYQFDNSIPVLRAGNIQSTLLTNEDLIYIPNNIPDENQILKKGDLAICISSGSAHLVGKTAQLDIPFYGTLGGFCGIIRPKNQLYGKYLKLWFHSEEFYNFRNADASGGNIQNLQFSNLPKFLTLIPKDLEAYESIIDEINLKLITVEILKENATKQIEAINALPKAILKEFFLNNLNND